MTGQIYSTGNGNECKANINIISRKIPHSFKLYCLRLEVSELVAYMESSSGLLAPYDLLVAADVFVYIGDLTAIMSSGARQCSIG